MLDVVDEPPVVAVVPAKPTETLGTQTISPLFQPCFLLSVPNHLMASDPLRHRWDLDWNTKDSAEHTCLRDEYLDPPPSSGLLTCPSGWVLGDKL